MLRDANYADLDVGTSQPPPKMLAPTVRRSRNCSAWRACKSVRTASSAQSTKLPVPGNAQRAAAACKPTLNYSKWDAIGSDDDDAHVKVMRPTAPPPPTLQQSQPVLRSDVSQAELDHLRKLMLTYLEPLRAPPSPSAPRERLACSVSPQAGWVRVHDDPPIYTCDDFLTANECEALIAAAKAQTLTQSAIGNSDKSLRMQTTAAARRNAVRTSSSCTLQHAPACTALKSKILALTGLSKAHLEPVNVTNYTQGQQYTEHQDGLRLGSAGGRPSPEEMEFMAQGGQRVATVLVYLNSVKQGGATSFTRLDLEYARQELKPSTRQTILIVRPFLLSLPKRAC